MLTHASLFSGIGGFDLAAQWAGWKNVLHCEINPFAQKILNYYWPDAASYQDITKTDFTIWRGRVDVLSGGFPCQPFSLAGQRKGTADSRHLWPEMLRAIQQIKPKWVVGENVFGLVNWSNGLVFEQVQADLETAGYQVQAYILPASAKNAPHQRQRVWFVAYSGSNGHQPRLFNQNRPTQSQPKSQRLQRQRLWLYRGRACTARYATNATSKRREKWFKNYRLANTTQNKPRLHNRIERLSYLRYATNTKSWRYRRLRNTPTAPRQPKSNKPFRELCRISFATNAYHQRCKRYRPQPLSKKQKQTGARHSGYVHGTWHNFPTQPPVCSRNDGLPTQLVGITVSKHRNESLKGYGNAIVPQVSLNIFTAINQYTAQQLSTKN